MHGQYLEHLSTIYRTSIETRSDIYIYIYISKSIEHLSNIYRTSIEIYRKSIEPPTTAFSYMFDENYEKLDEIQYGRGVIPY